MRIDVHAHYFPTDYLDRLDAIAAYETKYARGMGASETPEDLEGRLALMDRNGVDVQILSASPQLPAVADEAAAVGAARLANDAYADLLARHPERFRAFAALPLPHVDAALAELARALDELGFVGATVGTSVMGRALTDPAFRPLYEELDRRGSTLYVHPAGVGCCSHLVNDPHLTWPVGAPMEDTVAIVSMIQAGIPLAFPNMRIVASHAGGALPMLLQRLDNQAGWFMPNAPEPPSATARRLWYDSVVHGSTDALACAIAAYGAERLLLGTDFPYVQGEHFDRSVAFLAEAPVSEAVRAGIYGATAAGLILGEAVAERT